MRVSKRLFAAETGSDSCGTVPKKEQWRTGLRVSGALTLEVADLMLDTDRPTLRVRSDKGRKAEGAGASKTCPS